MNTHQDITAFHNENVTLNRDERGEMRDRRDANRRRVKRRLDANEMPVPDGFASQGSYVDKTMVQYPDKDYDIDDGVYFLKEDLVGPNGGEMTALGARKMVHDALNDGSFKTPPKLHTNCIRVFYDAGYNVDVPVYRIVEVKNIFGGVTETYAELAGADWVRSDAIALGPWFDNQNQSQSPDEDNGRQFRRIVRLTKDYASSRSSWRERVLTGFGITLLAAECYAPCDGRDDLSLIWTLKAMRTRLNGSLTLYCPVQPYDQVTSADEAKANYFRDRLDEIYDDLTVIKTTDDRDQALRLWSQIYNDPFFSDRIEETETNANTAHESKPTDGIGGFAVLAGLAAGAAAIAVSRSRAQASEPTEAVSKSGGRMNA